jgi:hypothetical protein
MATAARRTFASGDSFAFIVYAVAFAIGIVSILVGALSDSAPKTQVGFIALGVWAILATLVAIIYRSTHRELVVQGSSDRTGGARVDVIARIGVEGWAFWTIAGLLVAAIIVIIAV